MYYYDNEKLFAEDKYYLKRAQLAWIKFRDENCSYVGKMLGGAVTWESTYSVVCLNRMTLKRVGQLKSYHDCLTIGGGEECDFED